MRPKWSSVELEAELLARHFNVVMQELESGLLRYAHPYDAGSPKVWERAHSAKYNDELTVTARKAGHRRLNHPPSYSRGRLLAEKLEREMKSRLGNPCEIRSRLSERRRGGVDLTADLGREVNGEV